VDACEAERAGAGKGSRGFGRADICCVAICGMSVTCDNALWRLHADMDSEFGWETLPNKGSTLETAEGGGECEISDGFRYVVSSRGGGGSSLSVNAVRSGGRYCLTSEGRADR